MDAPNRQSLSVIECDAAEMAEVVRSLVDHVRTPLAESLEGSSEERPDAPSPSEPPGVQGDAMKIDEITPDEEFEAFLEEKTAELEERRRRTVKRLARASFYGHLIFAHLYPRDAAAPSLEHQVRRGVARPRHALADVESAMSIFTEFLSHHRDRYQRYFDAEVRMETRSGGKR